LIVLHRLEKHVNVVGHDHYREQIDTRVVVEQAVSKRNGSCARWQEKIAFDTKRYEVRLWMAFDVRKISAIEAFNFHVRSSGKSAGKSACAPHSTVCFVPVYPKKSARATQTKSLQPLES
jgi:hypothetical protein